MLNNFKNITEQASIIVKGRFTGEGSGHDWWHIERVRKLALHIAEVEGGDLFIIEMSALLHDMEDWKIKGQMKQALTVDALLESLNLKTAVIQQIKKIVRQVSFRGAGVETTPESIEGQIVQDADRLDAMGAIGIARAFSYGGSKNRIIFEPGINPEMHRSFSDYKKSKNPTINHFYEKLLLLKERMNTRTGRNLAKMRHDFMLLYLQHFFDEWNLNM